MTKQEFLTAIQQQLDRMPQSDLQKSLDYYSEMIDDRMEDDLSEEEAVEALGSIEEIVQQILIDLPLPTLVKTKTAPKRRYQVWEIVLLVLGSPLWIPLLGALVLVLLSAAAVYWCVILALYAVDLSFAAVTISGIGGAVCLLLSQHPIHSLLLLGIGMIGLGAAILWFFICNKALSVAIGVMRQLLHRVKIRLIQKKGEPA